MIGAVLFDMDGVLVDAREWHYEALNRALDLFGMAIDRDAHLATYDGLPTRRKLDMLSKTRGLPFGLHGFIHDLKQAYTLEISYARCKPRFAQQMALNRLKREGFRLAVCSNSIRGTVETLMRLARLDGYLDVQLSNEDVKRSKPDPEMYLTAMSRLCMAPSQCLIVEDNENGIRAARDSGAHVLEVASPDEVSYERIAARIASIEEELCKS
ncbi:MAG: HAD family phosphatase [Candidatus Protistobacter heckmanni]|nr:HAD family phosphatase [Candidatus Protistobacter heckmanni]